MDPEMQKVIDQFGSLISDTLEDMDSKGITDGEFQCPTCAGIVHMKIIENGDAYAYCETEDCFQTGMIHRNKHEFDEDNSLIG